MVKNDVHFGGFGLVKNKTSGKVDLRFGSGYFNAAMGTSNKDIIEKTDLDHKMILKECYLILGLFVLSFAKSANVMRGRFDCFTAKDCYDKGIKLSSLVDTTSIESKHPGDYTPAVLDIWKVCDEN